jgi:hypothetical protein
MNLNRIGGNPVDITKILEELRQERDQLSQAILSVERLALGGAKRRGRPPAWMTSAKSSELPVKKRGRPVGSKNKSAEAAASTAEKS